MDPLDLSRLRGGCRSGNFDCLCMATARSHVFKALFKQDSEHACLIVQGRVSRTSKSGLCLLWRWTQMVLAHTQHSESSKIRSGLRATPSSCWLSGPSEHHFGSLECLDRYMCCTAGLRSQLLVKVWNACTSQACVPPTSSAYEHVT